MFVFGALFALAAACGPGGSSGGAVEGPKTPAPAALPACSADACVDLASCPLTSKEHLDAFDCRPCGDEATKGCEDAKSCPVRDATTLEALVCRAIQQKVSCKDASAHALAAWQKDGEPPFLDDVTLKKAVHERYARQAPASLVCPAE
jgi:hypothetical protein